MVPRLWEALVKIPSVRAPRRQSGGGSGRRGIGTVQHRALAPLADLDASAPSCPVPIGDEGAIEEDLAAIMFEEQCRGAWCDIGDESEAEAARQHASESESEEASDASLDLWPSRRAALPREAAAAPRPLLVPDQDEQRDPPPPPPPPRQAGPQRQRRGNFPRYDYSPQIDSRGNVVTSYVRLSTTVGKDFCDMRAVCGLHRCTRTVGCRRKRPIGALWAFLAHGRPDQTKQEHTSYYATLEERELMREEFEALPDNQEWLDAEYGGPGLGEDPRHP